MDNQRLRTKVGKVVMNEYKYSLLDAEELGEDSEETTGVTAEKGTGEEEETKEEEVTL